MPGGGRVGFQQRSQPPRSIDNRATKAAQLLEDCTRARLPLHAIQAEALASNAACGGKRVLEGQAPVRLRAVQHHNLVADLLVRLHGARRGVEGSRHMSAFMEAAVCAS